MSSLLPWFDRQTGLVTSLGKWAERPVAGGPAWRFVWPATIVFTLLVEAITGLALWMYYSPGGQSSWESVYYLQYHVQGGWLLRAIHYYAGQAMLVLAGLYLVQMVLTGACRASRAFLFWTVLLMVLVTLGLNLTGDLLPWDQNSYWATNIRIGYLRHTPAVGPWLAKLAVGGPQFGTFTLTRFLALHAGPLTAAMLLLILLHAHLSARRNREAAATGNSVPYWPRQAMRDSVACLLVAAAIAGLSLRHGTAPAQAGIELGAPANPVDDPGTARPEWSFRGLYQLHELLVPHEYLSIFIIPGVTLLVLFAMPVIGRNLPGRILSAMIVLALLGGAAALTWQSYAHDARDEQYQAALAAQRDQAQRAKELAMQPAAPPSMEDPNDTKQADDSQDQPRIPSAGALALLADDPKTQGPLLFNQHCASCHDHSTAAGVKRPDKPTAADLAGFASRKWLTEFLVVVPKDAKGIASPKFFGNTKFKHGGMYGFIKDTFQSDDTAPDDRKRIIAALSHEAELKSQAEADAQGKEQIAAGVKLIGDSCTDCHTFHGKGTAGGPDLTGYGSRAWLAGIISNPAHPRFYGKENDRMPAFAESATDPKKNFLSPHDLKMLVAWLREEWYEAKK